MRRLILAIAFSSALAGQAVAGWQTARWGLPESAWDSPTSGEYYASGIKFQYQMTFDTFGLLKVELVPTDPAKCRLTLETMLGIYGESIRSEGVNGNLHQWRDLASNNLVYYSGSADLSLCSVTYEKLTKPNELGGL
jgi:hypothetical protein